MAHKVLNPRRQPVELHLSAGTVVLPAMGEAEVELNPVGERHLEYLAATLRVTVLPVEAKPILADEAPRSPGEAEEKPAPKRPRKTNLTIPEGANQ